MLGSKITIEIDDGTKFWIFVDSDKTLTVQGARPMFFNEHSYPEHAAESVILALTFSETARNEFFL